MTSVTKPLLQLLFLSLVVSFALCLNYLYAWTGPTGTAPNNNAAAPINVGTTNQVKDANLSVGRSTNTASDFGLVSYGKIRSTIGGIEFPDGTVQTTAGGGTVAKVASTINSATALGNTVIPYDDTIPQITEGTEFMTMSYTPTSASNNLLVQVVFNGAPEAGSAEEGPFTVALFKDATANALAAVSIDSYDAEAASHVMPLTYVMSAGGTSPITFRVRAGTNAAGSYRFNGVGGARKFGGVMASTITVTEFKP